MFSPRRPQHLKKLADAAKASYKQLEPFRQKRLDALRQFVGHHYGNSPAEEKVPLNFLGQAVRTYVRKLVGRRPRVRASTRFRELEPFAGELKDAINETIEEIKLVSTLEEIVTNALFGVGIAKIGITSTADNVEGVLHDTGEVFVDSIDLSDWVHDMNAVRQEAWQFCGNRYKLPRETIMANPYYDVAAKNLVHSTGMSKQLGMDGARRHDAHDIEQGRSQVGDDNDLHDMVELWDYWLPQDGLVLTCTEDSPDTPLFIADWGDGPEEGMYRWLTFQKVPNCIMPLPPVLDWLDLHELINALARKAGRQAERQKTVLAVAPSAEEDAKRIKNAGDGDIITTQDPTLIKELRFGGADQGTVALMEQLRQHANIQAGNIDSIGGSGPQTSTVGQDKLLHDSASELLTDMQEKAELFMQQVCRDIGYYLFSDPTGVKLIQSRVEGLDLTIPKYWGPDRREGKYFQYNIDIIPYSPRPQSPEQKLMALNGLLAGFGPYLPIMMAQGYGFDFARLISLTSTLADMPELAQVLIPVDPEVAAQVGGGEQGPKMPRSTTREYVRRNVGGQNSSPMAQLPQPPASQAGGES